MMSDDREFSERLELQRPDGRHFAHVFISERDPAWLEAHAPEGLGEDERREAAGFKFENRRASWLAGRYCAKRALTALTGASSGTELFIVPGVFGQPMVRGRAAGGARVSIAHSAGWGAAVAFFDVHPMGIDLEALDADRNAVVRSQATGAEEAALAACETDEASRLMWLWTAKEALAKTLCTGLLTPFKLYELSAPRRTGGWLEADFTNFAQYKSLTVFFSGMALSLVMPKRSLCGLSAGRIIAALGPGERT